ncbi:hypothetical protein BD626DRAFT_575551 [Schizophyllum amplum]|uniref:Uncharacterized protein n=1 Tax=Schizophyllum amplum TaxID=97359 RepID=A0A550BVI0_9AGAR|nr:hypothetical protein BD626DRAFT_576159 [Auriculariopsis ampla]TRM56531.1 hypothetical protein BD626DRAFT_575551 [Auriculariopsis ampla]
MVVDDSSHILELMTVVEVSLPHLRDDLDGVVNTEALAYELQLVGSKALFILKTLQLRFAKYAVTTSPYRRGVRDTPVAVRGIFYFFADLISFTMPGKKWTSTANIMRPGDTHNPWFAEPGMPCLLLDGFGNERGGRDEDKAIALASELDELLFAPHITTEDLLRVLRLNPAYGASYEPPDFGRLSKDERQAHRQIRDAFKKASIQRGSDSTGRTVSLMDMAFCCGSNFAGTVRLTSADSVESTSVTLGDKLSEDEQEEQEVDNFLRLELESEMMDGDRQ